MLPNVLIIGAMRCATSSLHYYLDLHPEISMSKVKELDFFVLEKNWKKGIKWYESKFVTGTKIRGESSPNYTKYPSYKGVPERMYSIIPDAKLIYMIRDPIDRIVSHYVHNYSENIENRTISESLKELENNHYINCSKYYMQIEKYLEYYKKPKIMVITLESLKERKLALQKIFRFLEVDEKFYSKKYFYMLNKSDDKKRKHKTGTFISRSSFGKSIRPYIPMNFIKTYKFFSGNKIEKPVLSEKLKQDLIDYLKHDVEQLRNFTGNDFYNWCL